MKLKKLHLFLILLAVLLLSSLGIGVLENFGLIEGNQNLLDSEVSLNSLKDRRAGEQTSDALDKGKHHDPFKNNVKYRNLNTDKKPMKFSDSNGITKNEIPPGDEHLYILKSEVVPPVCPKCPDCPVPKSTKKKECPPCPRPQRCPESGFTCKKVPNYSVSSVDSVLPSPMFLNGKDEPRPVLNSFAKFS